MTHISVLLAAYHGEKYITEQLESLFHQTRIPDEILIGDDSEDDVTFRAIESARKNYSGTLHVFRNPVRLGYCANFENLYRQASGDIVFFCDQDDVWLPEKIERMCLEMETHPECDLVFCDSQFVDHSLHPLGFTMLEFFRLTPKEISRINDSKKSFLMSLLGFIPLSGHDIALRKNLKYNVLPFVSPLANSHDQLLSYLASYVERMRCLPLVLTLCRRHDNNVSHLENTIKTYSPWDGKTHAEKLREFIDKMYLLSDFLKSRVPTAEEYPANPGYLVSVIRFFEKRQNILNYARIVRIFHLTPEDLLFYFKYCKGLRTLVHDLICPPIHMEMGNACIREKRMKK